MQPAIISDTSCLILLTKLGRLELLQLLFGNVIITQIIADEWSTNLPDWIKIENPTSVTNQLMLEKTLDKGEASAIALALEKQDCLLHY